MRRLEGDNDDSVTLEDDNPRRGRKLTRICLRVDDTELERFRSATGRTVLDYFLHFP